MIQQKLFKLLLYQPSNSLFHELVSVLLCDIICAPPGHFLFLQVRESNSLREASIQSSSFPPPVTTTVCQVSYLDRYNSLIIFWYIFVPFSLWGCYLATKDFVNMLTPCWNCLCFSVKMRFSLYLYGDFNGSLLVAIEENGSATTPLVWERNDQWTDDWEDVALQLTGLNHGCVKWKWKGWGAEDYVTLTCYKKRTGMVSCVA